MTRDRIEQRLRQHRDIKQTEIHALPRERMHDVRGVANERQTRRGDRRSELTSARTPAGISIPLRLAP